MTRTWSFFRLATGEFTGGTFSASSDIDLARNVPTGCGAIEGRYDPGTQAIDISTGEVVVAGRSTRFSLDSERRERYRNAKKERVQLESEQIRSISALLSDPADAIARENFDRRRARLEELRALINASETETTEPASSPR